MGGGCFTLIVVRAFLFPSSMSFRQSRVFWCDLPYLLMRRFCFGVCLRLATYILVGAVQGSQVIRLGFCVFITLNVPS